MNGFSRFCCSLGLLAAIGGGITLGIGIAQGGRLHRFVGAEKKEWTHEISKEQYEAFKLDGASLDIDISIISGDILLVESLDDEFKFDYTYCIDEKRINFPTTESPFKISEKNNTLDWFQFDLLFNYDSQLTISVPTWYENSISVRSINGDIVSNLKTYHEDIEFTGVNTKVTLNNIVESKNIVVKVVNGEVLINARNFESPSSNLKYEIESVNGDAKINLSDTAIYHYKFEKVTGESTTEGATSNQGMLINFKTVNGDLVILR